MDKIKVSWEWEQYYNSHGLAFLALFSTQFWKEFKTNKFKVTELCPFVYISWILKVEVKQVVFIFYSFPLINISNI